MIPLVDIVGDWDKFLLSILSDSKVVENLNTINGYYNDDTLKIYPSQINVFRAFKECPYHKFSVVILLQDPYHDGSSIGIALGNRENSTMSPSLRVVQDTLSRTVYKREEFLFDPTLVSWAKQGILLLNTALTVERGKPLSHQKLWSRFTQLLMAKLSDYNSGIIYCLWGKHADSYSMYINSNLNTILRAPHPVYSVYSGKAWDCDHFNLINKQLKDFNNTTIIW